MLKPFVTFAVGKASFISVLCHNFLLFSTTTASCGNQQCYGGCDDTLDIHNDFRFHDAKVRGYLDTLVSQIAS
jgi:hypothetical protein